MPTLRPVFVAAILTLGASGAWGQEPPPWPMAGHDAAHTGAGAGPAPPYRVAWTADAPAGGPMTEPVVAADRVVVLGRSGIAALGGDDGAVVWEQPRAPGPAGTPAIAGELVVHATGAGENASLVARSLDDGRRAWSTELAAPALGALAVDGDLLVVGTHDGRLLALDAATGEERWTHEVPGAFDAAPAMAEGLVLAVARRTDQRRGTLFAIDAEAGPDDGPAWRFTPTRPAFMTAAAIHDGLAVVGGTDAVVRAIELTSGEERWSAPARDLFQSRQIPIAPGDVVIADASHVYRLGAETGDERWTFQLARREPLEGGGANTLLASDPIVAGGSVLIGDGAGVLSAIDLETGRRIWRRDLGEGALSAPSAGPDAVYVSLLGEDGAVMAVETDPAGRRLDEVSPTVLFPLRAVGNFAVAAAAAGAAILLVFRVMLRPRRPEEAA